LGQLEEVAMQIGTIQQSLTPALKNPHILVFAADHGIAREGVSAYPQKVTAQMVRNFVQGGAAINVFTRQHGIAVEIIDAGVKEDFEEDVRNQIINKKISRGTESFLIEPAMTLEQCYQALSNGADCVSDIYRKGCNVIGFGEMGIGNTSSSALLMHLLTKLPFDTCVGKGSGLHDEALRNKKEILSHSLIYSKEKSAVQELLAHFGGFETAMMTGAFLKAAENKMTILVDGFNATVALLVAIKLNPNVLEYCIFTHQSGEKGHKALLEYLKAKPLLKLDMRLGEGSGAAVAYPLIQSAVQFLNDMASFEEAGISEKD
jgi:nicotinate-nucleotide--dimethylbenzimidazole phosphoribosyltransferase